MARARDANPPVAHPLIRRHPVSGRKSLYLSEVFTTHIEGLPTFESEGLLGFLVRHACKPEYQYRFRWEVDSIAMWDNRASMHYAVADYWPAHRLMHRLVLRPWSGHRACVHRLNIVCCSCDGEGTDHVHIAPSIVWCSDLGVGTEHVCIV